MLPRLKFCRVRSAYLLGLTELFQILNHQLNGSGAAIFIDIEFVCRVDRANTQPLFRTVYEKGNGIDELLVAGLPQNQFEMMLADDARLDHIEDAVKNRFREFLAPGARIPQ